MPQHDQDDRWRGLMEKAQGGDSAAYKQLLSEIYPIIEKYIIKRMGRMISYQDATQECITAIHNARHTYDPSKSFRPWMFAIVKYKSIDLLRKQQRLWSKEVIDDEYVATFSQEQSNIDSKEAKDLIQQALKQLPDSMRRAVVLTKLEGLNTKEASEKEGISEVAFRSRVSRAYKVMRKSLEKEIV